MGREQLTVCTIRGWLVALLVVLLPVDSQAAGRSALSRWLGEEATPQIRELLARHPRYAGQPVQIDRVQYNGLADALATLMTMNLQGRDGISLLAESREERIPVGVPARIDDLDCGIPGEQRIRLEVSAFGMEGRAAVVILSLLEPGAGEVEARRWHWQGALTQAELGALRRPLAAEFADGSLDAPWRETDVERAASDLQRQMVCALRPQVKTRLNLQWDERPGLPPLFTDVLNHSRYLLGNYAELGFAADQPDYAVNVDLTPFREGVWQLWLSGVPVADTMPPVQAVAYFKADELIVTSTSAQQAAGAALAGSPARGHPLDYLDVQMLDAWQAEVGSRQAELGVQLRLENRSTWPMDYAFHLSGGHYQHCVPESAYYRHEGYGRLEGRLDPGETRVEQLLVENATHRPHPWMGPRKCAGFRSLEGFESFDSKGYTVTDYVRWSL